MMVDGGPAGAWQMADNSQAGCGGMVGKQVVCGGQWASGCTVHGGRWQAGRQWWTVGKQVDSGQWMAYDGKRWTMVDGQHTMASGQTVVDSEQGGSQRMGDNGQAGGWWCTVGCPVHGRRWPNRWWGWQGQVCVSHVTHMFGALHVVAQTPRKGP